MHRYLLPASLFAVAFAIAADRLIPPAHAETPAATVTCEEGFRGAAGINREKVVAWMTDQRAAGRTNFLPYGINGSVGMICAW